MSVDSPQSGTGSAAKCSTSFHCSPKQKAAEVKMVVGRASTIEYVSQLIEEQCERFE